MKEDELNVFSLMCRVEVNQDQMTVNEPIHPPKPHQKQ